MPPRLVNLQSVPAFDYQFGPLQAGRMQDVGRNVGSDKIGLVIQTVAPANVRRGAIGTCFRRNY